MKGWKTGREEVGGRREEGATVDGGERRVEVKRGEGRREGGRREGSYPQAAAERLAELIRRRRTLVLPGSWKA